MDGMFAIQSFEKVIKIYQDLGGKDKFGIEISGYLTVPEILSVLQRQNLTPEQINAVDNAIEDMKNVVIVDDNGVSKNDKHVVVEQIDIPVHVAGPIATEELIIPLIPKNKQKQKTPKAKPMAHKKPVIKKEPKQRVVKKDDIPKKEHLSLKTNTNKKMQGKVHTFVQSHRKGICIAAGFAAIATIAVGAIYLKSSNND
jgi:hypothetical protein